MSSTTSTSGINTTTDTSRIAGLASGIDTESIVKNLVYAEKQRKVDPLAKQIQKLEWQQADYRSINSKLLALYNSVKDLRLQRTFNNAKAVSSSDETVLTATAGANAVNGTYSIQVSQLAAGVSIESTPVTSFSLASSQSFTLTGKDGSATITVDTDDTISDVVNSINDATDETGIKAVYDSGQNKFYLMTTDTGSSAKIEMTDTDGFLASVLNLNTTTQTGTDAVIKFNGGSDLTFSSNQFTYLGITMNLKDTGTTKITVSTDTDELYDKISSFVDAYNNVMTAINDKLTEKRYLDYEPLTEEQKEEMTDDQIEKWEAKAKSGLLRGDSLLISTVNDIRYKAMSKVQGLSGDYTSLSAIGINTEAYSTNGVLVIDEDKLKAALADDPEGVMDLFTASGDDTAHTGIAARLYSEANEDMKLFKTKAGSDDDLVDNSNIAKSLDELNERLDAANDRLDDYEERLWKQYTALETLLSKLNSQSSYLSSLLGGSSS